MHKVLTINQIIKSASSQHPSPPDSHPETRCYFVVVGKTNLNVFLLAAKRKIYDTLCLQVGYPQKARPTDELSHLSPMTLTSSLCETISFVFEQLKKESIPSQNSGPWPRPCVKRIPLFLNNWKTNPYQARMDLFPLYRLTAVFIGCAVFSQIQDPLGQTALSLLLSFSLSKDAAVVPVKPLQHQMSSQKYI